MLGNLNYLSVLISSTLHSILCTIGIYVFQLDTNNSIFFVKKYLDKSVGDDFLEKGKA